MNHKLLSQKHRYKERVSAGETNVQNIFQYTVHTLSMLYGVLKLVKSDKEILSIIGFHYKYKHGVDKKSKLFQMVCHQTSYFHCLIMGFYSKK